MTTEGEQTGWILNAFKYDDGTGKIFRVREKPSEELSEDKLSTCVILEWPLDSDMPSKDIMEHIKNMENALSPLDTENGDSVLFHIITGGGMREWCYYTTSYDWFINELSSFLEGLPRYPINIEYQEGTDWSYWRSIQEVANDPS